jgi:hypothetical protein
VDTIQVAGSCNFPGYQPQHILFYVLRMSLIHKLFILALLIDILLFCLTPAGCKNKPSQPVSLMPAGCDI